MVCRRRVKPIQCGQSCVNKAACIKASLPQEKKINMLLSGLGSVRIGKNCDLRLENAALGLRPRAAFSRPRSQFYPIRTSQPANNIYILDRQQSILIGWFQLLGLWLPESCNNDDILRFITYPLSCIFITYILNLWCTFFRISIFPVLFLVVRRRKFSNCLSDMYALRTYFIQLEPSAHEYGLPGASCSFFVSFVMLFTVN